MKIGSIISAIITVVIVVAFLPELQKTILETEEMQNLPQSASTMLEILPIVFVALIIVGAISAFTYGPVIYQYFKWSLYGSRMKRAYEAKFGYKNIEFDKEVDNHIKVMRTLQHNSPTWKIAEEWLKLRAQFVEIPWKDLSDEASQEILEKENELEDEDV